MARFLHIQCLISGLPFPNWARKWINIRKAFSNFYGFPRRKLSMMLDTVGMVFEGNQHSGKLAFLGVLQTYFKLLQSRNAFI